LKPEEKALYEILKKRVDLVTVPYQEVLNNSDAFNCESSAESDESEDEEEESASAIPIKTSVFEGATRSRGRSLSTFPGPLGASGAASGGGSRRRPLSIPRRKATVSKGGDGHSSGKGKKKDRGARGGFRADVQREEDLYRFDSLSSELEALRDEDTIANTCVQTTLSQIMGGTMALPKDRPVCALPSRLGARAFLENQVVRAGVAAAQVNAASFGSAARPRTTAMGMSRTGRAGGPGRR